MTQSGRYHGCSVATPFGVAKSGMKKDSMRDIKSQLGITHIILLWGGYM